MKIVRKHTKGGEHRGRQYRKKVIVPEQDAVSFGVYDGTLNIRVLAENGELWWIHISSRDIAMIIGEAMDRAMEVTE